LRAIPFDARQPALRQIGGLCHAWELILEARVSRSKRKTPIMGMTSAVSEAQDKAIWHRAYRRTERQRLQSQPFSEPRGFREFSDPWSMDKDGKQYWMNMPARWLRK
jgi:hypothetical protein